MNDNLNDEQSYLTFRLGKELFAASVDHVIKILQQSEETSIPQAPRFVKGVINHHGEVLPLIDLKEKFGMGAISRSNSTCTIIFSVLLEGENVKLGGLVEEVLKVEKVHADQVSAYPAIGDKYKSEVISGVIHLNEEFIMIMNVSEVFKDLNNEIIKE